MLRRRWYIYVSNTHITQSPWARFWHCARGGLRVENRASILVKVPVFLCPQRITCVGQTQWSSKITLTTNRRWRSSCARCKWPGNSGSCATGLRKTPIPPMLSTSNATTKARQWRWSGLETTCLAATLTRAGAQNIMVSIEIKIFSRPWRPVFLYPSSLLLYLSYTLPLSRPRVVISNLPCSLLSPGIYHHSVGLAFPRLLTRRTIMPILATPPVQVGRKDFLTLGPRNLDWSGVRKGHTVAINVSQSNPSTPKSDQCQNSPVASQEYDTTQYGELGFA